MDGCRGREREGGGLRNRQRDDIRGMPVTEDERVSEKEGISSPLGDEKPEGGGREEEEDREEQEVAMVVTETNQSFLYFFFFLTTTQEKLLSKMICLKTK